MEETAKCYSQDLNDEGQLGYKSRIYIPTGPSVEVSTSPDPASWATFWPETWQHIVCGWLVAAEVIQEAKSKISWLSLLCKQANHIARTVSVLSWPAHLHVCKIRKDKIILKLLSTNANSYIRKGSSKESDPSLQRDWITTSTNIHLELLLGDPAGLIDVVIPCFHAGQILIQVVVTIGFPKIFNLCIQSNLEDKETPAKLDTSSVQASLWITELHRQW